MRRAAPAIALFFLSPLVAEFLLGDFTVTVLWLLVPLAPMYGGGAVLIREVVRRTGRGWPAIVLLALAYGVLEEGLTTMSLFNPDYLNAHLLDKGYVPALGIAVPWTLYVLALHTIWSISVPIGLVEEWTTRRTTPWLRTPGLIVAAALFLLGVFGSTASTYGRSHYIAPWPQLLGTVVVIVALVVAAFRVPSRPPADRPAPRPGIVLAVLLGCGAVFEGATAVPGSWPGDTAIGVALLVIALAGAAVCLARWSRRAGWGPWHRFAAAAAGLLTYAWHSFLTTPLIGGGPVATPVSHAVLAAAAVLLLVLEARRIRARTAAGAGAGTHPAVAER